MLFVQLEFFVFFLLAFLLRIELCCLLVTIADEEVFRFLKICDVTAALEEVCLIHDVILPEPNSLFFILDGEQNSMFVKLFTWIVGLRLELGHIVIKQQSLSNVIVEFLVTECS